MWPTWFVTKDLESEEEVKALIHSEASDEEVHSKKDNQLKSDCSLLFMIMKQIQDLIANTLKV